MVILTFRSGAIDSSGFSRDCHGDLHSENVIVEGNEAMLFDCIEFSDVTRPSLRNLNDRVFEWLT